MIRKIDSNIFSLTILKVTTFSRIRQKRQDSQGKALPYPRKCVFLHLRKPRKRVKYKITKPRKRVKSSITKARIRATTRIPRSYET